MAGTTTLDAPIHLFGIVVPADDRAITIDACCSEFDVIVSVVDLDTDTTVALRDDGGCGSWHHGNAVSLDHMFGSVDTRYAVVVRGWRGAVGSYNISFDCETRSVSERACAGRPIPPSSAPTLAPLPAEVSLSIARPVVVVNPGIGSDRLFGQFAYGIQVTNNGVEEFDTVIVITGDRDGCAYDGYSNGLGLESGVGGSYSGVHTRTVISYRSASSAPSGSCHRLTDGYQTFTVTAHLKPAGRPWAERFASSAPVTIESYRGAPPVGAIARLETPWLNSYLRLQRDLVAGAIMMDAAAPVLTLDFEYVVALASEDVAFMAVMTTPNDPSEGVNLVVEIAGTNLARADTPGRRTARLRVITAGVNVSRFTLNVWLCKQPTYGTGIWENRLQTTEPVSVYRPGGAGQGSLQAGGGPDPAQGTTPAVDESRGPGVALALALVLVVVAAVAVVAWRRHAQAARTTTVVSLAAADPAAASTDDAIDFFDAVTLSEAFV